MYSKLYAAVEGEVADAVYSVLDIDARQGSTVIQSQGLLM